jgi:hypothetical protein
MNVAAEAVELGDGYSAFPPAGICQGRLELRATVERVRSLASLDLDEFADDLEVFSMSEAGQCLPLRFDTEPRPTLLGRGNSDVSDQRLCAHPASWRLYKCWWLGPDGGAIRRKCGLRRDRRRDAKARRKYHFRFDPNQLSSNWRV